MYLRARIVTGIVILALYGACYGGAPDARRYLDRRLSAPPSAGPRCFQGGADLLQDTLTSGPAAADRRWLVLDTQLADGSPEFRTAYLVDTSAPARPLLAIWHTYVGDSVRIQLRGPFPTVVWVLADRGDHLEGRGSLGSHLSGGPADTVHPGSREEFRAIAHQTTCDAVP